MKIIVYILYHDKTEKETLEFAKKHTNWAIPHKLPQTHLLESAMYATELSILKNQWTNADYVGTLSLAGAKRKINNFNKLCLLFDSSKNNALNLGDGAFFYTLIQNGPWALPNKKGILGKSIFDDILQKMSYEQPNDKQGFCNFWIAKPHVMSEYISLFANQFLPVLEASDKVWDDSEYFTTSAHKLDKMKIFGRPYYPFHCFIAERFVNAFVTTKRLDFLHWNNNCFLDVNNVQKSIKNNTCINTCIKKTDFDHIFYADKYPDLKTKFGYNEKLLLNHYNQFGKLEGRIATENSIILSIKQNSYVLFAMHGELDNDRINYIKRLEELPVSKIIVISTNVKHQENFKSLFGTKVSVVFQENGGLDFGLWKSQLHLIDSADCLVLANDSCYCEKSLLPAWNTKKSSKIWGMTDCSFKNHHLQSYFLVFDDNSIIKKVCSFILNLSLDTFNREQIIINAEIGLSRYLKETLGYKLHAVYEEIHVIKKSGKPLPIKNTSYYLWNTLRSMGCPLIKRKHAQ